MEDGPGKVLIKSMLLDLGLIVNKTVLVFYLASPVTM